MPVFCREGNRAEPLGRQHWGGLWQGVRATGAAGEAATCVNVGSTTYKHLQNNEANTTCSGFYCTKRPDNCMCVYTQKGTLTWSRPGRLEYCKREETLCELVSVIQVEQKSGQEIKACSTLGTSV